MKEIHIHATKQAITLMCTIAAYLAARWLLGISTPSQDTIALSNLYYSIRRGSGSGELTTIERERLQCYKDTVTVIRGISPDFYEGHGDTSA